MGLDLTGLGSVADFAGTVVERIFPKKMDEAEKAQKQIELQAMLQEREDVVIKSKTNIMVAELQQGDKLTKRARPMIIYTGLAFIALVHVIFPICVKLAILGCLIFNAEALTTEVQTTLKSFMDLSLPTAFWTSWGGTVSIYAIGRSAEKRGVQNKLVSLITGGK